MKLPEDIKKSKKQVIKSLVCIILIIISISNVVVAIPTKANRKAMPNYSGSLGTQKAMGSPLSNETFVSDDWNKWEMLAFGVFLSNFCTPFIDSYRTAFSSGHGGSEGSGRQALEFSAGGDVNSEGIIRNMLNFSIDLQRNLQQLKELKVSYSFYEYNKLDTDRTNAVPSKTATLRDLLVMKLKDSPVNRDNYTDGSLPYVISNVKIGERGAGMSDYLKIKSESSGINNYPFELIKEAALSRLFVDTGSDEITIFDMTDGYDIQILSALLAAVIESTTEEASVLNILEKSTDYNLYMDSFGNICIVHDGEVKIIIPAATNQHLTQDKRYNLLTSMLFNGNYISEDDYTIASGLEATNEAAGVLQSWDSVIRGGNSGADGDSEGIGAGQILIYEDTDTNIAQDIYNKGMSIEREADWEDLNLGKHLESLLRSSKQRGRLENPLKIEVVGGVNEGAFGSQDGAFSGGLNVDGENIINRMAQAAALLSNLFPMSTDHEVLNWIHSYTSEPMDLFQGQIYVGNSIPKSKNIEGGKDANEGLKAYINFYFNYITSSDIRTYSGLNLPLPDEQFGRIHSITKPSELAGLMYNNAHLNLEEEAIGSEILVYYLWTESHFGGSKNAKLYELRDAKLQDYAKHLKNVSMWGKAQFNYKGNMVDSARRLIKIYKKNPSMTIAADYLSLQEGTEFSVYSTLIYLTYLDFYGILNGEEAHYFNKALFENSGFADLTPEAALGADLVTEEDQKKQVLANTYLLLSPEGGRDYRNKLITNWFEDWMHQEYQRICYGDASTSVVSSSISTRMTEGFLQIDNYEENFITSWFLANYMKIVIALIAIFVILVIIVGIIKGQKLSWFFVSMGTIVLVFALAPSTGEVTPYICNKMIQKMFSENMTYWAISESVENASIESQYASGSQQDKEVLSLINSLNMLYLDKTIMIKKDISKKVIEKISVDYGEIQRLKSTRWLLPTIIQQVSADDRSLDYVYTTLTDLYGDMRSGYWLYARGDLAETPVTQFKEPSVTYTAYTSEAKKGSVWEGYSDTAYYVGTTSGDAGDTLTANNTSKAITRVRQDSDENFHTLHYLLDVNAVDGLDAWFKILDPLTITGRTTYSTDTWNEFADVIVNGSIDMPSITDSQYRQAFRYMTQQLINDASNYNSYDTEPKQTFGYLWMTETPSHYFYQIIKDTFKEDGNTQKLAMVIKQLQGAYEENSDEIETRRTFMNKGDTGHVRDFLDLEEIFTNVIPYMYTMQIIAGGEEGTNGILGEELMEGYPIYEDNLQSWLYRSNWVTKLVEYPMYAEETIIYGRDIDGARIEYVIESPLYPQNYPDERPMVFSEAHMYEQNLLESDLSVVELKLVKINKEVEKKWTLLINYSNTKGMSKEVMYRQMAIIALLEFNNTMSPDNWVSSSRALYPTTLDLRNISFDAVMKMVVISDTANSAYIAGDTMKTIIADGDTFSGILLLATAWIASYAVPFLRNIVVGFMFYLGILSMLMGLFRDNKKAAKSAGGFITTNIIFMGVTVCYYLIYALLITTSTADSVLSVKSINISTSIPTWKFLIIFIASIIYMVVIIKYLSIIWKNYRDMGFEIYHGIATSAAEKISDAIESVGDRVSGDAGGTKTSNSTSTTHGGDTTVNNTSDNPLRVQLVDSEVSVNSMDNHIDGSDSNVGDSGYVNSEEDTRREEITADDIDKAVDEGKK